MEERVGMSGGSKLLLGLVLVLVRLLNSDRGSHTTTTTTRGSLRAPTDPMHQTRTCTPHHLRITCSCSCTYTEPRNSASRTSRRTSDTINKLSRRSRRIRSGPGPRPRPRPGMVVVVVVRGAVERRRERYDHRIRLPHRPPHRDRVERGRVLDRLAARARRLQGGREREVLAVFWVGLINYKKKKN